MIVLAIDPSSKSTGWCIYDTEENEVIEHGTIKLVSPNTINRIIVIRNRIKEIIRLWKPEMVAIEELAITRNASTFKVLAGLQMQLEIICADRELLYILVRPSQWRSAIGINGKERKELKQNAIDYVIRKHGIKANEDEADAICIGEYIKSLNIEVE